MQKQDGGTRFRPVFLRRSGRKQEKTVLTDCKKWCKIKEKTSFALGTGLALRKDGDFYEERKGRFHRDSRDRYGKEREWQAANYF